MSAVAALHASSLTEARARVLHDYSQPVDFRDFTASPLEWALERTHLIAAGLLAPVRPGSIICRITDEGRAALQQYRACAGKGRAT
jgi:hypothetical protein